jgi:hypothetical protein
LVIDIFFKIKLYQTQLHTFNNFDVRYIKINSGELTYFINLTIGFMKNLNELKTMLLWQMTGEDFLFLNGQFHQVEKTDTTDPQKRYVYGLSGLRQLVGCSHVTAQRIKDSGKIKGCFSQVGRKLIFDADAVLTKLGK